MSGSTAKATRRDLRRAMGISALRVVQSHQDIITNQIVPVTHDLQQRLDHLITRVARIESPQDRSDVTFRLQQFTVELDDRVHLIERATDTFWHRLRWIVRGQT